jgi:hypothetical protein
MLTYQTHYQSILKNLLESEIQNMKDTVTQPFSGAIPDFSQYRYYIGCIEGLRKALELCEEAEALADGRHERG